MTSKNQILFSPEELTDFDIQWNDLVWGKKAGHMGTEAYKGAAFAQWEKYVEESKEYYCTRAEKEAIANGVKQCAKKIQGDITLVTRGGGSKFSEKDGSVAKEFEKAGCRIVGIVYLDSSKESLEAAIKSGKEMFKDAWHCPINFDFYSPNLRYPTEGTEVNTFFGFTMENVEGFVKDGPPKDNYIEHSKSIYAQMNSGAHLITTVDTYQDKAGIEKAYNGPERDRFARAMLEENNLGDLPLIFAGEYFRHSYIFAHNYEATKDTAIPTFSGVRDVPKGARLHYKSSLKLPLEIKLSWEKEAGFHCLDEPEEIAFDNGGKVALLHFQKG